MNEQYRPITKPNHFFYWQWDLFFLLCYIFMANIFGVASLLAMLAAFGKEYPQKNMANPIVIFALTVLLAFLLTNTLFYFVRKIKFGRDNILQRDIGPLRIGYGTLGSTVLAGILLILSGDLLLLKWFITDCLLPFIAPVWRNVFG